MLVKQTKVLLIIWSLLLISLSHAFADDDPCRGPNEILNMTEGGGNITSSCVVPFKKIMLEGEYEYETLKPIGWLQAYPQAELRIGLPRQTEIGFLFPNYIQLSNPPLSGFTTSGINLKHQLFQEKKWLFTLNGVLAVPGGSSPFGARDFQYSLSGIADYSITDKWGLNFMLEGNSLVEPPLAGGGRFSVYTPDVSISYFPRDNINVFAEIFAYSKTGVNQPGAVTIDFGFLYMLQPHIAFDFTYFRQVTNNINIYETDIMVGITLYQ